MKAYCKTVSKRAGFLRQFFYRKSAARLSAKGQKTAGGASCFIKENGKKKVAARIKVFLQNSIKKGRFFKPVLFIERG